MAILQHYGFISSIKYDNLTPWYTTTQENEVIQFKEGDVQRNLNALTIEANTTDLYIRIMPTDYCLYVPANQARTFDLQEIKSIQVMGVAGQKLRWSGQFY